MLIEGARRIGKSTIVEEFANAEYKSYILIDFNDVSKVVTEAFDNYLGDLDNFFLILSTEYNKTLYPKESLIIFDEIQKFPKARQSIKKLVKDGRYDYIETGSLISINENVQGDGSEWWHYIGPEFRLNWNGDRQYASSPYLNTTISSGTTAVSACHTVTNDEGADYTYTTTFEFVIVYSGYKLDFCPVCIGGVWNDGFAWVWEVNWLLRVENDGIYLIS